MLRRAKLALVAVWNPLIHTGRRIAEVAGAVCTGRIERCSCCGRVGPMLLRPRSIPPKLVAMWGLSAREARALVRKETLLCLFCGAKLRARRLSRVIIESFPVADPCPTSLREWAARSETRQLRIAEINLLEGVHEALLGLPLLKVSDFRSEAPDIPDEDLTGLSYENESFDLVLTSETLEHVPDLDAALAEIRRVLTTGGLHIFTVPVRPELTRTVPRSELGPPICHPGGDRGYPVFTEFGTDLVSVLDRAGFSTVTHFGPTTEDDLAQVYVSRRR